jgi:hypothetical protein
MKVSTHNPSLSFEKSMERTVHSKEEWFRLVCSPDRPSAIIRASSLSFVEDNFNGILGGAVLSRAKMKVQEHFST